METFHLGLLSIQYLLEKGSEYLPAAVEEPHIERAIRTLQEMAEAAHWLAEEHENHGAKNLPDNVWRNFERTKEALSVFGDDITTLEFVATKAKEFERRGVLNTLDREKLAPLIKKLAERFNPFRGYQFETVETLDAQRPLEE